MKKILAAMALVGGLAWGLPAQESQSQGLPLESSLLRQLEMLNSIPEAGLSEKQDPAFSIVKKLYDLDGPEFSTLRKLLGQAEVRKSLNPTSRAVCANVISQRWDSFTLSGNLYLAGLQSPNAELRDRSRQRMVNFIQPAHISPLISLLRVPGANQAALAVLREVTGKTWGGDAKTWEAWWKKSQAQTDLVGRLLADAQKRLSRIPMTALDADRWWYAPEGISDANRPYLERSTKEREILDGWSQWAQVEVKAFADRWVLAKPILDQLKHQPDPRVNAYLEHLAALPGYGDYASVVLAWRGGRASLPVIAQAYQAQKTVGRALARGSLGDRDALRDLLNLIEAHQRQPMAYALMDDPMRAWVPSLRQVGVVPAELAFELLSHRRFGLEEGATASEKKKAVRAARKWLDQNFQKLQLDRKRGYYTLPEGS